MIVKMAAAAKSVKVSHRSVVVRCIFIIKIMDRHSAQFRSRNLIRLRSENGDGAKDSTAKNWNETKSTLGKLFVSQNFLCLLTIGIASSIIYIYDSVQYAMVKSICC